MEGLIMTAAEIAQVIEVLKWFDRQLFYTNPPDPKVLGLMQFNARQGWIKLESLLKVEVQIER
jgi:hypothetical protein